MGTEKYRTEIDAFGEVKIPEKALWGIQTQRSLQNFEIGKEQQPLELIHALALIKKAAAKVNIQGDLIDKDIGESIILAADEILMGKLDENFPLVVWQTGSGTQTNMNLNEVLARRASQLLSVSNQKREPIHPNDHCNLGQSSNDTYPTAMHIAALIKLRDDFIPAASSLHKTMRIKAHEFSDVVKIGRTHSMDATPMTLGQEFDTFAEQISKNLERVNAASRYLLEVPQGGTAVGTGLNTPEGWDQKIVSEIANLSGLELSPAKSKFEHMSSHDALVALAGQLKLFAVSLLKVCNDLRTLSSGPRCGLGELQMPMNEQGSSIMPGKVNPTQIEALTQVCLQVVGNEATISLAGSQGHLQLNVYKPVIIYNLLQSISLLSEAICSFDTKCLRGIKPNLENIQEHLDRSLMLVTALVPKIGYDKAAEIAKQAFENGTTLKEETLKTGLVSNDEFEDLMDPKNMIGSLQKSD